MAQQEQNQDENNEEYGQEPVVSEPESQYPDPLKSIILNALDEQATDIYLNVIEDGLIVLFRVDNTIHEKARFSIDQGKQLTNQLKISSGMTGTNLLAPAEGEIHWSHGQTKRDIRVTMLPVKDRESANLRILSVQPQQWDIQNLGFSEKDTEKVTSAMEAVSGLVLVTGVTGAGKTTTMYSLAASNELNKLAAYSIEDPVEFKIPYVQQVEVNEDQGLSMQGGLRTILRMNPDLMMIGEIRDRDSAITAMRAALSGRLILATIHAHNAAGTIEALHYLGVPYYIIGSSLRLIIAQNLLRKLCQYCKKSRPVREEETAYFLENGVEHPDELFDAVGCEKCNKYGYTGQIGVFEIVPIIDETAHKIVDGIHRIDLQKHLRDQGINSITADALEKVKSGMTSIQEVFRVIGMQ